MIYLDVLDVLYQEVVLLLLSEMSPSLLVSASNAFIPGSTRLASNILLAYQQG